MKENEVVIRKQQTTLVTLKQVLEQHMNSTTHCIYQHCSSTSEQQNVNKEEQSNLDDKEGMYL
jgi:hypothetical protein